MKVPPGKEVVCAVEGGVGVAGESEVVKRGGQVEVR